MFNPIEIINSWITSFNPNDVELNLAKKRIDICSNCEFRKEVIHNKEWSHYCGPCGCPINKKIFTDQYGTCPLGKWNFIEQDYMKHLKIKKKSII
jgi:hypothetical protein